MRHLPRPWYGDGDRCILQAAKQEGQSDLSPLTEGTELQSLEFALLKFQSRFGPVFPHYALIPPLITMHVLCHFMFGVCNLFVCCLSNRGLQLRDYHESQKRLVLWTYKQC